MQNKLPDKRIIIITGHYGSGKTNIAVNAAIRLKELGRKVSLIDFDIVNPYFRAADSAELLTANGIRCILPEFANSNLDIPALPAEIYSVFDPASSETAIFDVGGDDAGAVALGMYREQITNVGYEMLYVINNRRPLTLTPDDAVSVMRDIEASSGLVCTGVINNSNLGAESDATLFAESFSYADETAQLAEIPLLCDTTCLEVADFPSERRIARIQNYTKNIYGG